ncbi:MAG: 23S rRNA (guanosine(2251)-2'-O)-methyltransferase RlmB [candidate division NC10 bacterium]|nr:23S rRNA (guanosine(2251)-2'-O)-methyltransferase RlmB [candidate division NC10 bacterium]
MGRLFGAHAVWTALQAGRRSVEKLYTVAEGGGPPVRRIVAFARSQGIPVKVLDRRALAHLAGTTAHQGVVAQVAEVRYVELEDLLGIARQRREAPFLLIPDGVQDPRNLGALVRTAEASGAHGVVIPKDRSAGVSPVAAKAAAGALEYLPLSRVTNIARALDLLKGEGLWVYGADVAGGKPPHEVDLTMPLALVLGGEGRGLRPLVRSQCDLLLTLPMVGQVPSLNVSVAAGVIMYEVLRQRMQKP